MNLLQLELDKKTKQLEAKERLIDESNRLREIEKSKLSLRETELREATAKLSVYQQIDSSMRMSSLYDDVEPELLKNKNLKQKCEDLERQVAILRQQNQSELSLRVIELEQKVEDSIREKERQVELNKLMEKQIEEMRNRYDLVQSQVEVSLSQSHENMGKIIHENKKLEAQNDKLIES